MKGNEGMEWHLHLNSTFHLLWAPKRFTNPAEQNHLRKTSKWSRPSLPFYTLLHTQTHFILLGRIHGYTRGREMKLSRSSKNVPIGSRKFEICDKISTSTASTSFFPPVSYKNLKTADTSLSTGRHQPGFENIFTKQKMHLKLLQEL